MKAIYEKMLKGFRQTKKLTQKQMARIMGMSLIGYQRLEYDRQDSKIVESWLKLQEEFKLSNEDMWLLFVNTYYGGK